MIHQCFEESRKIIQEMYYNNDKNIKEACLALDNAVDIYFNHTLNDMPERINLTNYDGDIIHTVINRSGKPETVTINPKPSYNIIPIIVLLGIIGYYMMKRSGVL